MDFQVPSRIAVIGSGTMGQGIAQVCASAGHYVQLYDVNGELTRNAVLSISKNLDRLIEKGKSVNKEHVLSLIERVESLQEINADLLIEVVVENLEVKQKLFRELENVVAEECVLVSNTSSLSITQIAKALSRKGRFGGLHFFNPATAMPLVEIIKGAETDSATVELLKAFCVSLSKQYVVAQDSPGFIVNRVARHYYVEALLIAEEGVSDYATIDRLMRSAGFKMGPFELMDLIGIDVNLSVTKSLHEAFHGEPRFRPSRIQQQKVDAGFLGRKTKKGFYEYP